MQIRKVSMNEVGLADKRIVYGDVQLSRQIRLSWNHFMRFSRRIVVTHETDCTWTREANTTRKNDKRLPRIEGLPRGTHRHS